MLFVIEMAVEAETMVAVFGVGVVESFEELQFTDSGLVPGKERNKLTSSNKLLSRLTSVRGFE